MHPVINQLWPWPKIDELRFELDFLFAHLFQCSSRTVPTQFPAVKLPSRDAAAVKRHRLRKENLHCNRISSVLTQDPSACVHQTAEASTAWEVLFHRMKYGRQLFAYRED